MTLPVRPIRVVKKFLHDETWFEFADLKKIKQAKNVFLLDSEKK